MIPIRAVFECHVKVSDLARSMSFYGDVLGLKIAHRAPEKNAAFYWVGGRSASMLGLWQVARIANKTQLAFRVDLPDLFIGAQRLRAANITPRDAEGNPTDQPVVLAWMPAAALYFHDPDENLLEFICMLGDAPHPQLGVLGWKDWLNRNNRPVGSVAPARPLVEVRERS